ncbi:hypothetical protein Sango_2752600 [Sesamum angolense]|uniref:RNase H type-1 domain-containing protein n=1 Tax=Sesamum angolense TaxID=2727404 RepID=A0AAE1VXS9_9LAMI|nr:hypothetical protein Sango_2752600 [Sesamum angolense]
MRRCNKRDSAFLLNVTAVRQRRRFPTCLLRVRQCRAYGNTLLPFGSASVIRGASLIWFTSGGIYLISLGSSHSDADTFPDLWFTWTQQNAAKYRGVPFLTDGIILEVQRHLCTLYAARTLTSTQWKGDLHRAGVMGFIFQQTVPQAPSIMRWHAPSLSWFKLNTDGSSLGIQAWRGAAAIIRDSVEHMHLAYQVALGTGTSVLAELTAVWRGLEFALIHGLASFVVEVDATAVITLLQSHVSGKWEVQHLIMHPTVASGGRSARFQGGEWRS